MSSKDMKLLHNTASDFFLENVGCNFGTSLNGRDSLTLWEILPLNISPSLTLLHPEWLKLNGVLAFLGATGSNG